MKTSKLLSTIGLGTLIVFSSGIAQADPHRHDGRHGTGDRARVVQVEPIYEMHKVKVVERIKCRPEHPKMKQGRQDAAVETLVGGAIGGLIGNQLANDGHHAPATAAGAIVGAVVGHEIGKNQAPAHRASHRRERCKEVVRYREENRLVGYRVKYRYHGKTYWTRTKHHPGKYLDVQVKVRPAEF